jgi:hypothetical protein
VNISGYANKMVIRPKCVIGKNDPNCKFTARCRPFTITPNLTLGVVAKRTLKKATQENGCNATSPDGIDFDAPESASRLPLIIGHVGWSCHNSVQAIAAPCLLLLA